MRLLVVLLPACSAYLGDPTSNAAPSTGSDDVPAGGVVIDASSVAAPPDAPIEHGACCHDRGHCVDGDGAFLDQDSCDDGQSCVPDQLLDHDPISTCTATTDALGTYTGVCLSDCLHFGATQLLIDRGDCDSHFECVPCVPGVPGC
ncbi:MAG: hypothetical protein QM831_18595 [Kofleriaceae bacterium]